MNFKIKFCVIAVAEVLAVFALTGCGGGGGIEGGLANVDECTAEYIN